MKKESEKKQRKQKKCQRKRESEKKQRKPTLFQVRGICET